MSKEDLFHPDRLRAFWQRRESEPLEPTESEASEKKEDPVLRQHLYFEKVLRDTFPSDSLAGVEPLVNTLRSLAEGEKSAATAQEALNLLDQLEKLLFALELERFSQ